MGRILHLSDIHFGCENAEACAAALTLARDLAPELVLITGDITQSGLPQEFRAAAAWLEALPGPIFVTPGNHDTPYWSLWARLFDPWGAFQKATGHPAHDHQFLSPALMVRGVTTARGWQARLNWSKGVIDLDQTRRAAEALRRAPSHALKIVACHHPLVEMIGAPMTGAVRRGEAAALIFAEAGVDLIVTGHVHVPFALPLHLGDRASYAVGCGTLSRRERGEPPGFNRIEWDEDEIRVTPMAWTGAAFADVETWTLPRRRDTRGG